VLVIPERLQRLAVSEAGRAWLDALPALVEHCARDWSLQLGEAFEGSNVSLVLAAIREDGSDAVLKVQFPHPECAQEAMALRWWDGDGAVRLLAHAPAQDALLIERCRPGRYLSEESPEIALAALIELLPRLWKPAREPFRLLADEAAQWAENLPRSWERAGRPFDERLVEGALATLADLAPSQGESVLLHQDLHGDNVLRAERETWLAIDPKPLAGEREFGLAPIIRSRELGHGRMEMLRRLDRLTAELGLDRERARGWAFLQTLAWAFEGDRLVPGHLETAVWLDDAR